MLLVSRRWFVIGSAAVVAAAALPAVPTPELLAEPAVLPIKVGARNVYDLTLCSLDEELSEFDRFATCRVFVDGPGRSQEAFFDIGFNLRSTCRWTARPVGEIIIRESDRLRIEVEPPVDFTAVQLHSYKPDTTEHYTERYKWFGGKLAETEFFVTDMAKLDWTDDEEDDGIERFDWE